MENGRIKEGIDTISDLLEDDLNIFNCIQSIEFTSKRKFNRRFRKITCRLDIIPGSGELDYYGNDEDMEILKKKLSLLDNEYDYIIIDFPPANNLITMICLIACDYIIVPLNLAKDSSFHGYEDVMERCREAINDYGNTSLRVLGIFYIDTQLHKIDQKIIYEESMEENTKAAMKLFYTTIKHDYSSTQFSEGEGEPLCICCGRSEISKNYQDLTDEIIDRIEEEMGL